MRFALFKINIRHVKESLLCDIQAKTILREAFDFVLKETDPRRSFSRIETVLDVVRKYDQEKGSAVIVSIGKIGLPMADELMERCGLDSPPGMVTMPYLDSPGHHCLKLFAGGHPYPNESSLRAAQYALKLLEKAGENDLAVFLISGGGSAAMESPLDKAVSLEYIKSMNRVLVSCGANIVEMNTVRKHLSGIKGGRLAVAAAPARQITIFISDVPRGKDSSVASGPTMPDESTLEEMVDVIERYSLKQTFPESIVNLIESGTIPETPKQTNPVFHNAQWHCLLSNENALEEAKRFADRMNWICVIDTTADDLRVDHAAEYLIKRLKHMKDQHTDRPVCIVAGGEVRSPVKGNGLGGRNQAFVLECAIRIQNERIGVLSGGTDGIDGNSSAAGAVADGETIDRAGSLGMDPVDTRARSDSYTFFHSLHDDIVTGPTGNNLCDLRMLIAW